MAIVLYLLPAQNGEIPPETERKIIKIASVAEGKKTIKNAVRFRQEQGVPPENVRHSKMVSQVPPHKRQLQ